MSVAYRSRSPRTPGTEWVALSQAAASVLSTIRVQQAASAGSGRRSSHHVEKARDGGQSPRP